MNTRPISRPTTIRFRPVSRAELSPIRALKRQPAAEFAPQAPAHDFGSGTPASDPVLRFEPAWPTWHRGALDRMQPVLTRFRD